MIRFLFFAVSCLLYHGVCGVNVVSEDSVASVEQDTVIENQIIIGFYSGIFSGEIGLLLYELVYRETG